MKVKITITGEKVHEVGYRSILLAEALRLGLDFFNTYNTFIEGKQAVITTLQGKENQVNRFINYVKSFKPKHALVKEIKTEEFKDKIPPIERTINMFQMEQWVKGIDILLEIRKNTELIPEIAENTRLIPEIAENTRLIPEIAENTRLIREDLKDMRGSLKDLTTILKERFERLEKEIEKIKLALQKAGIKI